MPLETTGPDSSHAILAVLAGFFGVIVTKAVDLVMARRTSSHNENTDFRRDLKDILSDERKDRNDRETILLNEIHRLSNDLRDASSELERSRQETLKAHLNNVHLEKRVAHLEIKLEQHDINDADPNDPRSAMLPD